MGSTQLSLFTKCGKIMSSEYIPYMSKEEFWGKIFMKGPLCKNSKKRHAAKLEPDGKNKFLFIKVCCHWWKNIA